MNQMKATLLSLLHRFTPSRIILNNCVMLVEREQVGIKKYGVDLTAAPLTHEQALQHLLEEQLDGANYIQKALMTLRTQHQAYADLVHKLRLIIRNNRYHQVKHISIESLESLLDQFEADHLIKELKCSSSSLASSPSASDSGPSSPPSSESSVPHCPV